MKKILYIPLDERPCNYLYPQSIMNPAHDVELVIPPLDMLGNKKSPADTNSLWEFVFENAGQVDAIVLSVDMMLYGGLLPSRLHHLTKKTALERIENFRKLREKVSLKTPILAFNLIMRTPRYNSSDEEPDYYEDYGEDIFNRAFLLDKQNRTGLTEQEKDKLNTISIPENVLQDYEWRRNFNIDMNLHILELVQAGTIDFLSIPQDDSAEYGYTAQDQQKMYAQIATKRMQSKVMMYPGADEVGASLLARAYNNLVNRQIKVYPFFSSSYGHLITPLYEDRPMGESLKAHLLVAGCTWVSNPEDADFVLAINSPGKVMQEAANQKDQDITYSSYRQMHFFIEQLKNFTENNIPVVLADNAFANGGEIELIEWLDDMQLLDSLISYKGWNTNCNTLGTSIAAGIFGFDSNENKLLKKNLLYHIFEDAFYQAHVRGYITEHILPSLGANYFSLNNKDEVITKRIEEHLMNMYESTIKHSFSDLTIEEMNVSSPWQRMFEISLDFIVKEA